MTQDPQTLKAALRRELAELASARTDAERALASRKMCERLRSQRAWQRAKSVLFYWPMPGEPDLAPMLTEALAEGKLVALPRFIKEKSRYVACHVKNQTSETGRGYYGITEPLHTCPVVPFNKLDFFLVPGVGFALNGGRLGRGKGYYDQMLAEAQGIKCGVAFDWQVTAAIPVESHDVCLDCILTPTRWHKVTSTRRF